ncbi:MAG: hypothetical protein HN350_04135 [Phycisphaerales bacterium]|jgi:hypothetical protein|nr:hypothetical protein [Phycisphaerales bacterium]
MKLVIFGCVAVFALAASADAADGLFFREDTRDIPPALPITQKHISNPDLILGLHGPGKTGIKKSYHESTKNDPHYIWSGQCKGNWAVSLAKKNATADLSGAQAQIRMRTKNYMRTVYVILKTPGGWLVSNQSTGSSREWQSIILRTSDMSWSKLDIASVTRGDRVTKPDLTKVSAIGFTDLKPGGGSKACSRVDWIEVWTAMPKQAMHAVKAADGYQFYDRDRPVLFYHTGTNSFKNGHHRANYVHPLTGLSGETLTEDFPQDHLHHRGIFWAWHQATVGGKAVGDPWECKNIVWESIKSEILDGAAVKATVHLKAAGYKSGKEAFVQETVTIRAHGIKNQARAIDFTIELKSLADAEVKLGGAENDKGYGGFSTRIVMPKDLVMTGPKGVVKPIRTPVAAGEWLNFTGTFGRSKSSIAVLAHPKNPGYPTPWILRSKGSAQNAVWPGRHAVAIPKDKPIILRYRILLHQNADISKQQFK